MLWGKHETIMEKKNQILWIKVSYLPSETQANEKILTKRHQTLYEKIFCYQRVMTSNIKIADTNTHLLFLFAYEKENLPFCMKRNRKSQLQSWDAFSFWFYEESCLALKVLLKLQWVCKNKFVKTNCSGVSMCYSISWIKLQIIYKFIRWWNISLGIQNIMHKMVFTCSTVILTGCWKSFCVPDVCNAKSQHQQFMIITHIYEFVCGGVKRLRWR